MTFCKAAKRAEYGTEVIKRLSIELTAEYGKRFTKSNLYNYYSFYKAYPVSRSHYATLLQVKDEKARNRYEKEYKIQNNRCLY